MSQVTETDLKRLEDLIINGLNDLRQGQAEIRNDIKVLREEITALKLDQAEIKGEIKALDAKVKFAEKIPDLSEKVGELKNWRSIALLILGAAVGWFARNGNS